MMNFKNKLAFILSLLLIILFLLMGCRQEDVTLVTFSDDFSDSKSGWVTKETETISYEYVDGKYRAKNLEPNFTSWVFPPINRVVPKYTVEADMIWEEGEKGSYGFIFNHVNKNNFYTFEVNSVLKYYTLQQVDNGSWKPIVNWMKNSQDINKRKNHFKLVQNKDNLKIYINNVKIIETQIDVPDQGVGVGLLTSTPEDKSDLPVVVQFDNFKLSGYTINVNNR